MAKKKRDTKRVREWKMKFARDRAQRTRDHRQKRLREIVEKDKLENFDDIYDFVMGVSAKAREYAAFGYVIYLSSLGCTPKEIIERLSIKTTKKES